VTAQVLSQALTAEFKLAIIAETCSDPSDDVIGCLFRQLPPDVAAAARVYSTSMARQPVLQVGPDQQCNTAPQSGVI
jgi:hypothetical protein